MDIVAKLSGPFRLETDSGADLTPASAKVCGLLLLLLASPNGTRERAWLQDKLWSDRGPDQSAGSLRQAVFQCKKALGDHATLLTSSKLRVSLDLSKITICEDFPGDFAEGIDARDKEFEDWLAVERANRAQVPAVTLPQSVPMTQPLAEPPTVTLAIDTTTAPNALADWFSEVIADQCAALLHQLIGANVVAPNTVPQGVPAFHLSLSTVQGENDWIFLRARLSEGPFRLQIWSGHRVIKAFGMSPDQDEDVLQMIFEISETIRTTYSRQPALTEDAAPVLNAKAITSMFTMTEHGATSADELLAQAQKTAPQATQLAWRSQIRVIQYFEKYASENQTLVEESRDFTVRALERDPNNATVVALAANTVNYLEARPHKALELARRAVTLNAGNPFAWWTFAAAQLAVEDLKGAYASALKSKHLLHRSTLEFLPQSILGGAALAMGNEEKALHHFERSLAFRPSFKPSLRYALGLNLRRGNIGRARTLSADLAQQEAGFRPDQLVEDSAYPTSLLRKNGGYDFGAFRDLIE